MIKTDYQKDEKVYYLSPYFFKNICTVEGLLKPYNLKDYIRKEIKWGKVSNPQKIYNSIEVYDYSEHEWVDFIFIAKEKETLVEQVYTNIITFFKNIIGDNSND